MNRHDIHILQNIRGYPALSVLVPTHRAPEVLTLKSATAQVVIPHTVETDEEAAFLLKEGL
jgi:hypothetical protein